MAINDLGDAKTSAPFEVRLRARAAGEDVEVGDGVIKAGKSELSAFRGDPAALPWGELEVDLVIESTGFFADAKGPEASRRRREEVVISAPATDPDVTIVLGRQRRHLRRGAAPHHLERILHHELCRAAREGPARQLHVEQGFMTTIHAYTNDQQILDLPHKDLRRARAAAINLNSDVTGAARAIGLVLPDLKGKVDGISVERRSRTPITIWSYASGAK